MTQGTPVEIKAAKGRPMLTWVGKHPLRQVMAFPAQHVESYAAPLSQSVQAVRPAGGEDPCGGRGHGLADRQGAGGEGVWSDWPAAYPRGGLLFHGDNKEVLAHLLANGFRGKVKLVYIDPPFDSGADYVRRVSLRGPGGTARLDGEE
jgi:hypothetical protein